MSETLVFHYCQRFYKLNYSLANVNKYTSISNVILFLHSHVTLSCGLAKDIPDVLLVVELSLEPVPR